MKDIESILENIESRLRVRLSTRIAMQRIGGVGLEVRLMCKV